VVEWSPARQRAASHGAPRRRACDDGHGCRPRDRRSVVIRPVIAMIACAGCNQILDNAGSFTGPRLAELRITAGTLVPTFSPDTLEYTVDVGNAIAQARIIATATATLELDRAELRSGELSRPIMLAEDATTDLHVQVTDVVYTIHVHRGAALAKQSLFKPN